MELDWQYNLKKIDLIEQEIRLALKPISHDAENKLWEKFRLEWSYNSNHMEGNTLTYDETKLLLLFEKTTGDHDKREYDEMQAHDVAVHLVREWANDVDRNLTESDIKNLNKIILVKSYWKEALTIDGQPTRRLIKVGDYKEYPNSVRLKSGEMFHYASPEETPRLMQELIEWYQSSIHPIWKAAGLHYKFIRIHPFDDGNGRIARLLSNYVLMYYDYPPIIIKSADKENYLTALRKADAGDNNAFLNYFAEQVIWSMELKRKAVLGESLEDPDDIDKEIAVLKKQVIHADKMEKATPDNICDILENTITPLFEMLSKKANELSDLFHEHKEEIQYKVHGKLSPLHDPIWKSLEMLIITLRQKEYFLEKIKFSYELQGLMKTIDGLQMWMGLNVYFYPYNYGIKTPDMNSPKIFPYGRPVSDEEKRNLINPMIRDILKRIKEAK